MAANKKSEVTKLLTVTLDKIHESKRTKTGPNLRKSLLVASVLHKARDIYVSEIKNVRDSPASNEKTSSQSESQDSSQSLSDSTSASKNTKDVDSTGSSSGATTCPSPMESSSVSTVAVKRRFMSSRSASMGHNSIVTRTESNTVDDDLGDSNTYSKTKGESDSNNDDSSNDLIYTGVKRRSLSVSGANICCDSTLSSNFLDELAAKCEKQDHSSIEINKENKPPSTSFETSQTQSESTISVVSTQPIHFSSCARRLKRRSSVVDDESNSDTYNHPYSIPNKVFRVDSVDSYLDRPSEKDFSSITVTTSPEASTQINNLVRIFSHNFDMKDTSVYEVSTELQTFNLCRDSISLTA